MIVLEATAVHESGPAPRPHAGRLSAGDRRRLPPRGRAPSAARDAALRPALPRRAGADRERAAAAGSRALGDPEPALPRRAGRCAGGDRRAHRRLRALGRAGRRGRARRDRALGRAQLPVRAVLHAGPEPPRGRVGGGPQLLVAVVEAVRNGQPGSRSASGSRPIPRPPRRSRPSSPASSTTSHRAGRLVHLPRLDGDRPAAPVEESAIAGFAAPFRVGPSSIATSRIVDPARGGPAHRGGRRGRSRNDAGADHRPRSAAQGPRRARRNPPLHRVQHVHRALPRGTPIGCAQNRAPAGS